MSNWDKRFLGLAEYISHWSKDPSTTVGAVIVDDKHRIISTGFNGFPVGVEDSDERLHNRDKKLELILHAETNAILFANKDLYGCTLYTYPLSPCIRCSVNVIQSGIKRVVSPKTTNPRWIESCEKAKLIMEEAGLIVDYI